MFFAVSICRGRMGPRRRGPEPVPVRCAEVHKGRHTGGTAQAHGTGGDTAPGILS